MEKNEWHIAVALRVAALAAFLATAAAVAGCSARLTGQDGKVLLGLEVDKPLDWKLSTPAEIPSPPPLSVR
jgi:hypothetical protein